MAFNLPRGYVSPSQIAKLQRCAYQYKLEYVHGFQPPDQLNLLINRQTHNTILEFGLGSRLNLSQDRAIQELVEYHQANLKRQFNELEKVRLRNKPTEEVILGEAEYFSKIVASEGIQNLLRLSPVAIEKEVRFELGGVPVVARLDLIAKVNDEEALLDLKRVSKKPSLEQAQNSTQLTTEALGTGIDKVGLVSIVETQQPYTVYDMGQITSGQKERVEAIYFEAAKQISSGVFPPVDRSDKMKGWICSYQHCSFWSRHARDKRTGENISCKFGERSKELS